MTPAAPWRPNHEALDNDRGYWEAMAKWCELHHLDGWKVHDVLVTTDADGFRWVHAFTRTVEGPTAEVITALTAPTPVP